MKNQIGQIALLVRDYDEALDFYINRLGFIVVEDTCLSDTKRWVVIEPDGERSQSCKLLLAKATGEEQLKAIGNQTGGRVFLFLYTSDFDQFYRRLLDNSVEIVNGPRIESYGRVLVFKDLYGNLWDLIQNT
jgi:catechol 2,3-dioxygenase-like lactoylglutathione lyase family enzyme